MVTLLSSNVFDVKIYNDQCELQADYRAEQVYVNGEKAYMDIYLPNGQSIHVPFKYGVREAQVSFEGFFRSYQYENGRVIEKKDAYCKGSI